MTATLRSNAPRCSETTRWLWAAHSVLREAH